MAVTLYLSTDASAPVLTGQTGSLCTLLDAILVNGYGSKAAAGWTIAYTGTSLRDYKQGTGSNGYYLDVVDNGPGGGSFREARMRGYETMSALGTGTQAFPTVAQASTGVFLRKSNTADATARPWYCVADATCFYLFVDTGDYTGPNYSTTFMFGDIFSYKSGDLYNTMIIGRSTENSASGTADTLGLTSYVVGTTPLAYTAAGHYIDRSWTGVGGSILSGKMSSPLAGVSATSSYPYHVLGGGTNGSNYGGSLPYPNGPDGGLELAPIYVINSGNVRGYLKGLWAPCHNQPLGHTDTVTGTGNMAGKSFMALNVNAQTYGTAVMGGQLLIETSNTWS